MGNVVYLETRRARTHCAECDPECERPVAGPVRRDPRTEDVITPCPVCGHAALVTAEPLSRRREETGWAPPPRSTPGHVA